MARGLREVSHRALAWAGPRNLSVSRVILCFLVLFVIYQGLGLADSPYAARRIAFSDDEQPIEYDAKGTSSGRAGGRIIVTGGGGNLGKHIVRRLLRKGTSVTILDTTYYPEELEPFLSASGALPNVHIGDIRNTTALSAVFTSDVVGVIHLAAVSRVLWCLENEDDCWDVNERGTKMVLNALSNLNRKDSGKRWFILASSREVYGNARDAGPTAEDAEKKPTNIYGASKLAAERVVEKHLRSLEEQRAPGSLHAIALRLSNVYGGAYDHVERLVPSITTQALSHQIIQIAGGQQNLDLLHIDDCIDAFLLATSYLQKSLHGWSFQLHTPRTFLDAFNVAKGESVPVIKVVDTVVRLTRSKSPLQYISGDARFPNVYKGSTTKARDVLGFSAKVDIDSGLLALVKVYLQRTHDFLTNRLATTCGKSASSLAVNAQLQKLNGCSVHVEVDVQGEFASVLPRVIDGQRHWLATREISSPGLSTIPLITSVSRDGSKTLVRMHADAEGSPYLGVKRARRPPKKHPKVAPTNRQVTLESASENGIASSGLIVDWELEVNPEQSAIRLVVPGTSTHLVGPTYLGGNFSIIPIDSSVWPFRMTPLCCPAPAPWPFASEDPVEFTIAYQRTSLERPFLASPTKTLCDRLERARDKVQRDLATLPSTSDVDTPPRPRKLSTKPTDWSNANLPACSNICDHPTICVDTGDCQCVLAACAHRQRFPFASSAHLPLLSYPPRHSAHMSLMEMVEHSSWRNVLRPQASRFIGTKTPFPRIHVPPPSAADRLLREEYADEYGKKYDVGLLRGRDCFSADDQLEKGVARMNIAAKGGELTFVRHYQNRFVESALAHTYADARDTVEGFDASKVVIPFTHDWGQCLTFDWDVWRLREKVGSKVPPLVRSTTAWSVMGDLNSPCYRPHQDVVVPPRTCLSSSLVAVFRNMSHIRPARDRQVLATFKGSAWGTGDLKRLRTMCYRDGWRENEIGPSLYLGGPRLKVLWNTLGDYDYLGILNDTIFCPQPAGTTGWSTRLIDSIYVGCIPVIIGEATHYPFFDMLDWGKISVTVDISDLSNLEETLLARYSLEVIERLQANIMLVRDAFIYPLDDTDPDHAQRQMVDDRGPLFFALHSTRMRMLTKWPSDETFDRP